MEDKILDEMVRDFTTLGRCSKSEVRRRIKDYTAQRIWQVSMQREDIKEQDIAETIPPRQGH